MPPAVSALTMPNRNAGEDSPSSASRGRKSTEKTDEEDSTPLTKRGKGRPKGKQNRNKNSDEDRADVDNETLHYQDHDEDDSDDDNRPGEKRSNATEVFRTYRIHAMRAGEFNREDSDDEHSGPYNGMIRLHDRWREEWNHGIQVPVNGQNLPVFETASNDLPSLSNDVYHLPQKYIAIKPQTSQMEVRYPSNPQCKYVHEDTHEIIELPEKILYNGDRFDEIWLEKLNKFREDNGSPQLTFKRFIRIMNALEIQCYNKLHEELIKPLHINSKAGINDDDALCDICGFKEQDDDDEMLYCDSCNACFHLSCYGLERVPSGVWKCQRCKSSPDIIPPCIMCPCKGGALKETEILANGHAGWCHVGCALWIPECKFADPEAREKVIDIGHIPEERWHLKCIICDTRNGACIQCKVETCRAPFHVSCATRSGYEMRIEASADNPESETIEMIALCEKHRSVKSSALKTGDTKSKSSSDEEIDDRENVQLKNLETRFFMYVDEEEIVNQLREDRLSVSDVYEYWKLKRHQKRGKALISNVQIDFLEGAYQSSTRIFDNSSNLIQATKRLRCNWDKLRNLNYMIVNREKHKLELVKLESQIFENIMSQLASPVPLSTRSIAQLMEHVKFLMPSSSLGNAESKEEERARSPSPRKTLKRRESLPVRKHSTASDSLTVRARTKSPKKTADQTIKQENSELSGRTRSGTSFSEDLEAASSNTQPSKSLQKTKTIKTVHKQFLPQREPSVVIPPSSLTKAKSPKKITFSRKIQRRTSDDSETISYSSSENDSDDSEEVVAKTQHSPKRVVQKRSRYNPLPTSSNGQRPERRLTRALRPAIDYDSPHSPQSKRSRLEITPIRHEQRTVCQQLADDWSEHAPNRTPISSRTRRNEDGGNSNSSPPVLSPIRPGFSKQQSVADSEISEEIGEEAEYLRNGKLAQNSITPPPCLSPHRNFARISGFKKNLYRDDSNFADLGGSLSPKRIIRTSPFKETNSISQRTRHRSLNNGISFH